MYRQYRHIAIWVAVALLLSNPFVIAQSIWLNNSDKGHFGLELLKPVFKGSTDYSVKSYIFSLNSANQKKGGIAIDIPYIHYEEIYYGYYADEVIKNDAIGNPYIGFQSALRNNNTFIETGIRLPFASDEKYRLLYLGGVTDIDRIESYAPKYFSFHIAYNYYRAANDGLSTRLRISPSFLFYTGDEADLIEDYDKTEFVIHYSGQLFYKLKDLTICSGITGIAAFSQKGLLSPDGYFAHQLNLAFDYQIGWVRPGFMIRMPLDGYLHSWMNSVIGLNARVDLK